MIFLTIKIESYESESYCIHRYFNYLCSLIFIAGTGRKTPWMLITSSLKRDMVSVTLTSATILDAYCNINLSRKVRHEMEPRKKFPE